MRYYLIPLFVQLGMTGISLSPEPKVKTGKDFKQLAGNWKGELTYLDYSTGKPYTMPADVVIRKIARQNAFEFANRYPNEPKANNVDTLEITEGGRMINSKKLVSRDRQPDGTLKLITETAGLDGNENKPALIRHTYIISPGIFISRKDVLFSGDTSWIMRHKYSYRKIGG